MAKAKGVDLTKVTDALVAAYTKHEQDEVTAGTSTQAETDKEIAAFKAKVDEIVNGTFKGRHDAEPAPTTTTPYSLDVRPAAPGPPGPGDPLATDLVATVVVAGLCMVGLRYATAA